MSSWSSSSAIKAAASCMRSNGFQSLLILGAILNRTTKFIASSSKKINSIRNTPSYSIAFQHNNSYKGAASQSSTTQININVESILFRRRALITTTSPLNNNNNGCQKKAHHYRSNCATLFGNRSWIAPNTIPTHQFAALLPLRSNLTIRTKSFSSYASNNYNNNHEPNPIGGGDSEKNKRGITYTDVSQINDPRDRGTWILDEAGVLQPEEYRHIQHEIEKLHLAKKVEIVVVTLSDLDLDPRRYPMGIKSFATQLFNRWGIGSAEDNDGILILLVLGKRRIEIEVGTGLERTLNQPYMDNLLSNVIVPHFRQERFGRGLCDAINELSIFFAPGSSGMSVRTSSSLPPSSGGGSHHRSSSGGTPNNKSLFFFLTAVVAMIVFGIYNDDNKEQPHYCPKCSSKMNQVPLDVANSLNPAQQIENRLGTVQFKAYECPKCSFFHIVTTVTKPETKCAQCNYYTLDVKKVTVPKKQQQQQQQLAGGGDSSSSSSPPSSDDNVLVTEADRYEMQQYGKDYTIDGALATTATTSSATAPLPQEYNQPEQVRVTEDCANCGFHRVRYEPKPRPVEQYRGGPYYSSSSSSSSWGSNSSSSSSSSSGGGGSGGGRSSGTGGSGSSW